MEKEKEEKDKKKTLCYTCKHRILKREDSARMVEHSCTKTMSPLLFWAIVCNGYEEGFKPIMAIDNDGKIEEFKTK